MNSAAIVSASMVIVAQILTSRIPREESIVRRSELEELEQRTIITSAPCPYCRSMQPLNHRRLEKHVNAETRVFCVGSELSAHVYLAWKYAEVSRRTAAAIAACESQLADGSGLSESAKDRLSRRMQQLKLEQQIRSVELAAIGRWDIVKRYNVNERRARSGGSRSDHR
jgi:hypothetical protein